MTNHNDFPATPESQFPPEQPGPFRIGEIVVGNAFISETGEILPEVHGRKLEKRVVTDVYQQADANREVFIVSVLNDDESGFRLVGSSEYSYDFVSTGKILPRDTLIKFALENQYPTMGIDALKAEKPMRRGSAKLSVLDIVEQVIADKIAHGERVTDAETAINHNRRVRDSEADSYLMGSAVPDPTVLADIDIEALLRSGES